MKVILKFLFYFIVMGAIFALLTILDSCIFYPDCPEQYPQIAIIPAIIGAAGVLGGAAISALSNKSSNDSAKDINAANIEMQRETNAQNERLQREVNAQNYSMHWQDLEAQRQLQEIQNSFNASEAEKAWQRQTAYNDPSAIMSRLSKAGLNPYLALGNGSSISTPSSSAASGSTPSVPARTPMVAPNMISPRSEYQNSATAQNLAILSGVVDAISKISQSKLNIAQKERTEKLLGVEFDNIISQTRDNNARAALQEIQTNFEQIFGPAMRMSEVRNAYANVTKTLNESALLIKQGEMIDVKKVTESTQQELNRALHKVYGEQRRELQLKNDNFLPLFRATLESLNSSSAKNRAEANYSNALSVTENQFRQFRNDILSYQRNIAKNESALSDETFIAKVNITMDEMIQAGLLSQVQKAQLDYAIKNNNWYEVTRIFDMLDRTMNHVESFVPFKTSVTSTKSGYDEIRGDYFEDSHEVKRQRRK